MPQKQKLAQQTVPTTISIDFEKHPLSSSPRSGEIAPGRPSIEGNLSTELEEEKLQRELTDHRACEVLDTETVSERQIMTAEKLKNSRKEPKKLKLKVSQVSNKKAREIKDSLFQRKAS